MPNTPNDQTFNGKALKRLRRQKKMTQSELGNLCNVSQGTISLWEKTLRRPDLDALRIITKTFNVPADIFLLDPDDPMPCAQRELPLQSIMPESRFVRLQYKLETSLHHIDLPAEVRSSILRYSKHRIREYIREQQRKKATE